jgi:hypothetical protein
LGNKLSSKSVAAIACNAYNLGKQIRSKGKVCLVVVLLKSAQFRLTQYITVVLLA